MATGIANWADAPTLQAEFKQWFLRAKTLRGEDLCLWPSPYNKPTYEAACAFVFDAVRTWNEAARQAMAIPRMAYLEWFVWHWLDTKRLGQPMMVEKTRRMIVSWTATALELWDFGLRPGEALVAGQTYRDAQKFCYRLYLMHKDLALRHPDWKLADASPYGSVGTKRLDALALPNGSTVTAINSEPESFRGDGVASVRMEEASVYDYLDEALGQAATITQASEGRVNGHVVMIGNASPNDVWNEMMKPVSLRELDPSRDDSEEELPESW